MMPRPQAPSGVTDLSSEPRDGGEQVLKQYANEVIENSHGTISRVYWLGGNDVLYEFSFDHGNRSEEEMEELLIQTIENHTSIDAEAYDGFYKVGDRFFALVFGAGASIVEIDKQRLPGVPMPLTEDEIVDNELEDIRRRAGIVKEDGQGLGPGAQMIYKNVMAAVQDAEEMGGVSSSMEYEALMMALIDQFEGRIRALKSHDPHLKNEF